MKNSMKKLLYFLPLLAFACTGPKSTPENYQSGQLQFGMGGGFSGQVSRYAILDNGDVFYAKSAMDSMIQINTLDENLAKQLFQNALDINMAEIRKVPVVGGGQSTMQSYLRILDQGNSQEIQWSDPRELSKPELQRLFNLLMAVAKNKTK